MKLRSLISLLILGLAVVVHAQEPVKPAPFPYTPPPRKLETVSKDPKAAPTLVEKEKHTSLYGRQQPTPPISDATRAEFLLPPGGPGAPPQTDANSPEPK